MTSSAKSENALIELLVSDIGDVQVVLRPELPFTPENFQIDHANEKILVRGEGFKIHLDDVDPEVLNAAEKAGQIYLVEFTKTGMETFRENDLLLLE